MVFWQKTCQSQKIQYGFVIKNLSVSKNPKWFCDKNLSVQKNPIWFCDKKRIEEKFWTYLNFRESGTPYWNNKKIKSARVLWVIYSEYRRKPSQHSEIICFFQTYENFSNLLKYLYIFINKYYIYCINLSLKIT